MKIKQNYLDYQGEMDLSTITEYTEHGTPYDNRRSLLPNNNYYAQSGEQPNEYANLDQTNGSSNYKFVCVNSVYYLQHSVSRTIMCLINTILDCISYNIKHITININFL